MSSKLLATLHTKALRGKARMTLADCPVRVTLDVLRGKWKPLILFFMKPGDIRYSNLRAHLPAATEKVFVQQLRELERDRIVSRTIYPETPPRVEYGITAYGETLVGLLDQMADWGQTHRQLTSSAQNAVRSGRQTRVSRAPVTKSHHSRPA